MDSPFYIGSICITPHTSEREIQFLVTDHDAYLFRLVPVAEGFTLSKLDLALDHCIDQGLVKLISDTIENHYC